MDGDSQVLGEYDLFFIDRRGLTASARPIPLIVDVDAEIAVAFQVTILQTTVVDVDAFDGTNGADRECMIEQGVFDACLAGVVQKQVFGIILVGWADLAGPVETGTFGQLFAVTVSCQREEDRLTIWSREANSFDTIDRICLLCGVFDEFLELGDRGHTALDGIAAIQVEACHHVFVVNQVPRGILTDTHGSFIERLVTETTMCTELLFLFCADIVFGPEYRESEVNIFHLLGSRCETFDIAQKVVLVHLAEGGIVISCAR